MLINCHIGLLYNTELVKLFRFKSNHHLLEIVAHYRIALRIDFVLRSLTLINWESFQFDFVNKNLFYCVRMWIFNKNGMDLQIELNKQKKTTTQTNWLLRGDCWVLTAPETDFWMWKCLDKQRIAIKSRLIGHDHRQADSVYYRATHYIHSAAA